MSNPNEITKSDNTISLFDEINQKLQEVKNKNTETAIEDKMKERNNNLFGSKVTTNIDDICSDIQEQEISIRRNNREEEHEKKRRLTNMVARDISISLKEKIKIDPNFYEQCNNIQVEAKDFTMYLDKFRNTNDINSQYLGLVGIRKLSSLPDSPPIQEIVDAGLVFEFLKLLDHEFPEIQFETLWCLTNVASGTSDHVSSIVSKDGTIKIVNLMESKIVEVQSQAIWCIGNIAGDSVKVRDKIISQKGLEKIINILKTAERQELVKQCVWSLSNFCRGKPAASLNTLKPVIDLVIKAIYRFSEDIELLVDSCWILSYLTEHHKSALKIILSLNALPKLLHFLDIPVLHIQLPCLRVIGNVVSGNAKQTQQVVELGGLEYLKRTLMHDKKSMRKETCWILSNLAAGTQTQVEEIIKCGYLPILRNIIEGDDPEIQKEACWAVCNLTSTENKQLAQLIVEQGIIETICKCLTFQDPKVIAVSLEGLGNLLNYGKLFFNNEENNPIVLRLETLGMFDQLENLQYHPVEIVYEKTLKLLETYFNVENKF